MNDSRAPDSSRGFADLVPWADPYIVGLVEKLRREERLERASQCRAEQSPPLNPCTPKSDWSRRTRWPRWECNER
mgnify:CR=1 FL=1